MNRFDPNAYSDDDFFEKPIVQQSVQQSSVERTSVEQEVEKPQPQPKKKKSPAKKRAPRKKAEPVVVKKTFFEKSSDVLNNIINNILSILVIIGDAIMGSFIGVFLVKVLGSGLVIIVHWIIAPVHLVFFLLHHLFFRWVTAIVWYVASMTMPNLIAFKFGVVNKVVLIFILFAPLYAIFVIPTVYYFVVSVYHHYDNFYFYLEIVYSLLVVALFMFIPEFVYKFMLWLNSRVDGFLDYSEHVTSDISLLGGSMPFMLYFALGFTNPEAFNFISTGKVPIMAVKSEFILNDMFFANGSDIAVVAFFMMCSLTIQGLMDMCEDIGIWNRPDDFFK